MRARSIAVLIGVLFLIGCSTAAPPTATPAPPTLAPPTAAPITPAPITPAPATPAPTPTLAPVVTVPPATPTPAPVVTPQPTAAARTVTSDDGALTIDIPPGALPADVALTITAQGSENLPPELAGINVRTAFYLIEPDGLTFAEPVTVTRRVTMEALGYDAETDGIPLISLALRSSDGTWEWLADQEQDVMEDGTIELVGHASHTSHLFAFGGSAFVGYQLSEPSLSIAVAEAFSITGAVQYEGTGDAPQISGLESRVDAFQIVTPQKPAWGPDAFEQRFTCQSAGSSWVGVDLGFTGLQGGSELLTGLGLTGTSGELYLGATLNCIQAEPSSPIILIRPYVCITVVHEELDNYISYLDWKLRDVNQNYQVDYFEVQIEGANGDEPMRLVFDPEEGEWFAKLGLMSAGTKKILKIVAHLLDGREVDYTSEFLEEFPDGEFEVRFPEEDAFGDCEQFDPL